MFGTPKGFKQLPNALEWERFQQDKTFQSAWTFRARVPGGWLIAVQAHTGVGVTYMFDPEHKWQGTNEA